MKRILISLLTILPIVAFAQASASPVYRFMPLLSGYNVALTTNVTYGVGTTNAEFTTYQGVIEYSLTNNIGGSNVWGDAFKYGVLLPDSQGDYVANAQVCVYAGNTNWFPIATTNAFMQWYIPPAGFTNTGYFTTAYAGWPLAMSGYQPWMYPATTNTYPGYSGVFTNTITVNLYRAPAATPNGTTAEVGPAQPLWETTPGLSFTVTVIGVTPVYFQTNLPATFLQGGPRIKATVTVASYAFGQGFGTMLNQLGLGQPQP